MRKQKSFALKLIDHVSESEDNMEFDSRKKSKLDAVLKFLSCFKNILDTFLASAGKQKAEACSKLEALAIEYKEQIESFLKDLADAIKAGDASLSCMISRELRVRCALLSILVHIGVLKDSGVVNELLAKSIKGLHQAVRDLPSSDTNALYVQNIILRIQSLEFIYSLESVPEPERAQKLESHVVEFAVRVLEFLRTEMSAVLPARS